MRIFFLCRTGHHTSILAAGLYLGLLREKVELREFLTRIRGFGKINFNEIGTPYFVGKDKCENEVFTIGVAKESILFERAVNEFINIIGVDSKERKIINVSSAVSGWTRIGLILRRLSLSGLADRLFFLGARSEVGTVAKILNNSGLKNIILE